MLREPTWGDFVKDAAVSYPWHHALNMSTEARANGAGGIGMTSHALTGSAAEAHRAGGRESGGEGSAPVRRTYPLRAHVRCLAGIRWMRCDYRAHAT